MTHQLKFTHAIFDDGTPLCRPDLSAFPEPISLDVVDCWKCRASAPFRIAEILSQKAPAIPAAKPGHDGSATVTRKD